MNEKRINNVLAIFIVSIVITLTGLTSCEKYSYDPPVYTPPDTTGVYDPVSFSQEVAPLFVSYKCTDCHGGAISPDLTASKAYESLTGGGFIDTGSYEESIVVIKIEDPSHGGTWSTEDLWLLFDWIYIGAPDN